MQELENYAYSFQIPRYRVEEAKAIIQKFKKNLDYYRQTMDIEIFVALMYNLVYQILPVDREMAIKLKTILEDLKNVVDSQKGKC